MVDPPPTSHPQPAPAAPSAPASRPLGVRPVHVALVSLLCARVHGSGPCPRPAPPTPALPHPHEPGELVVPLRGPQLHSAPVVLPGGVPGGVCPSAVPPQGGGAGQPWRPLPRRRPLRPLLLIPDGRCGGQAPLRRPPPQLLRSRRGPGLAAPPRRARWGGAVRGPVLGPRAGGSSRGRRAAVPLLRGAASTARAWSGRSARTLGVGHVGDTRYAAPKAWMRPRASFRYAARRHWPRLIGAIRLYAGIQCPKAQACAMRGSE